MSADFTTITDENGTHTLRHTWTVDDARTGIVDAFLAATEQGLSERPFGKTPTMRIQGPDGQLIPAATTWQYLPDLDPAH